MKFEQAGWFIPGTLKPGWANHYQSNFNDLRVKMAQLGLESMIPGMGPEADLGFYFSQGRFDFIQLLRTGDFREPEHSRGQRVPQIARRMVAYSLWFSNQGWGGFSPLPILEAISGPGKGGGTRAGARAAKESSGPVSPDLNHNPAGWYLLGNFEAEFYRGLEDNLGLAREKRIEVGLEELSPFYFTETSEYQGVQLLRAGTRAVQAAERGAGGGIEDITAEVMSRDGLMEYIAWFAEKGFGSLLPTPFMSTSLVSAALILASRNP